LGEVKVQPYSRQPQRFRELRTVYIGESFTPATVAHRRAYGNGVILRLQTIRSREAARELIGQTLYVPEAEAVPLAKGEYFVHQIVGLAVVTTAGEALGTVTDIVETGSNDVYVVRGARGEVLVPALKDVIKDVDLDAGTMTVELPPGLLD
jgi:16S rRNA processing protein RimM